MSRISIRRCFHFLPKNHAGSNIPPFTIGVENGFLPRQDPIPVLPREFSKLEDILQRMPVCMKNGQHGLLHHGTFGVTVNNELPLYDVDSITDLRLLTGNSYYSLIYSPFS